MDGGCEIEAVGVRKAYRLGGAAVPVLTGVDLRVRTGECLYLVGPSGSGKSTLLSILGCVLRPDEGVVRICGEEVGRMPAARQARFRLERIGFVFQRFHLFAGLRAWENVRVVFDLLGWSARAGRHEALRLLDLVGLTGRANHRIGQLSMGQRQRVAIARALAADPRIVLADEPTASLDAESGCAAIDLLKRLCRELGKTAIVVTHDTRIYPWADRILTLRGGQVERVSEQTMSAGPTAVAI